MELLARQHGLPVELIGRVGGDRLVVELAGAGATGAAEERGSRVADSLDVAVADLERAWEHGLPRALGWVELEQDQAALGRYDVGSPARDPGAI